MSQEKQKAWLRGPVLLGKLNITSQFLQQEHQSLRFKVLKENDVGRKKDTRTERPGEKKGSKMPQCGAGNWLRNLSSFPQSGLPRNRTEKNGAVRKKR